MYARTSRYRYCGLRDLGLRIVRNPKSEIHNPKSAMMRPFTSTISLDEARRRLDANVRPIARIERVRLDAAAVQTVGRRGADILRGDRVVASGHHLTPSRVGALAAIGCTEVAVYARPRVAILSTGNEVVEPGARLAPGQIFDVNRFTLAAI